VLPNIVLDATQVSVENTQNGKLNVVIVHHGTKPIPIVLLGTGNTEQMKKCTQL
jgi:putative NIF3 family GTP cyclohydrolase 1 type 2